MRKLITMFLALFCFLTVKAQTTLMNEGFEVIPHSFTSSSTASIPNWDTTKVLKSSGLISLRGKPLPQANSTTASAVFSTVGHPKVYLKFKHICKLSSADKGSIRYRIDGGLWKMIPSADTVYLTSLPAGNPGYMSTGFSSVSYSQWLSSDSNAIPTDSWWKEELFDVSSLMTNQASVEIQFRIERTGNLAAGVTNYGWLIDDIQVIGAATEIGPPLIVQQPVIVQDTVLGTGPWTIRAKITDESIISSANLVYSTLRLGVPAGPFTVPMTLGTGNVYSADIPSMSYLTHVDYYITATDEHGNAGQMSAKWFFNKRPPAEIIVGTGISNQRQPFGALYGYERSASIYTADEINSYGTIETMAWNVATPKVTILPVKIYLKSVTASTQTADTWANLIAGATLVYDASLAFTPAGWQSIDITDFNYTSNNIMVLCESSYGGSGASGAYPYFTYTTTPDNKHQYFNTDSNPPSSTGTTNALRPNVKFGFSPVDVPLDASMNAIVEPTGTLISTQISDVKVRIKSGGSTDLTSATINWTLDGLAQTPYSWTGLLTQDQVSANLTLASAVNFAPGSHAIKVWVSAPNGGTDLFLMNDTIQKSIYSCGGTLAAGTYTVGGTSPDFATLQDVKTKLNVCGISGPVVLNIRPGTYNTSLNLTNILGGSYVNTVTIKSENNDPASVVILDATNDVATLTLDSVSNFRLQSVTLKTTATSKSRLVWLKGRSVDVQFTNNIFEGLDTNSTSTNFALFYSSKGAGEKDSLLVVGGNTLKKGSYGIYLNGVSTNPNTTISIQNNTFLSQAYEGIYLSNNNNYTINSNTITQSASSTQSFYGIYLSSCKEGLSVSKNKISAKNLYYGMYISSSKGTTTNPMLISNNFIASSGTASSGTGFYLTTCDTTNFFYNTVNLNGTSTASRAIYVSSGSALNVRNNNFANNAGGYAYYISTMPTNWLSNYNNLYSSGGAIGYYSSAKIDLAAWRTAVAKDTNSVTVNPNFPAFDNFHTFEMGLDGKAQPLALVTTDLDNQVRSTTIPDIGCDEFEVSAINLAITDILQPASSSRCTGTGFPIKIRVKSVGSGAIDFAANNAVFTAQITGVIPQTFTLTLDTGSLISGASWDLEITDALDFSTPGIYDLKIFSTLPADTVRLNDTINESYDFSKVSTFPYDVNFSVAPDPAWTVTQISGTGNWSLLNAAMNSPILAPEYGTGMLYFNSNNFSSGIISRANTPIFDFTGITHPYLEFWMSHNNSVKVGEGITVRISSDGGTTWSTDTLTVERHDPTFTTPGWKLHSKHLTALAGETCVLIGFEAASKYGNNMAIDRVVVRDLFDNDLQTNIVYTKGKLPVTYGTPDSVRVIVENVGALTQYNKIVTVELTGANTQTLTYTIDTIQSFTTKTITIPGLDPTIVGVNTVTVSVPTDQDDANNMKEYRLESTNDYFGYADTSAVTIKAAQGNGLLLSKFQLNGTRSVRSVKAYITGGTTLGKVVYGVVLNNAGQVIGYSDNDTIVAADTAQWRTFTFPNWHQTIFTDTTFYVGIAQVGTGYNPLGAQTEAPVRPNTFYTCSALTGGARVATTTQGRFMIEAEIGPLPPYDAVLQAITNPETGCGIGTQAVTLNIKNNGINDIAANELTAWYTVNGGVAISLPVDVQINSGDDVNFSFVPADFSAPTVNVTYTIKAWINLPTDPFNDNDTISNHVVVSKPIPSVPTILTANPTSVEYNMPVTLDAENPTGIDGDINWYTTNVSTTALATDPSYTSGLLTSDTNFFASFSSVDGRELNILGTGTVSASYVPFYFNWDYSWSSVIYKRSEIQHTGTIDTLWIEVNTASTTGVIANQKIYLSTVADSTFANTNYINPTAMTLVYNGGVTVPASGWIAVPLTTPYNYTGNGHLLLHWENWDGSYSGNPNPTFKSTTMASVAKYKYDDGAFPTVSGTMASSRTNIKFNGDGVGCASPRVDVVVNVNNIPTVEVKPMAVTAPTSGCGLHQESITITVKNNLQTVAPAGTFVFYQINGGTPVADTMEVAINVGETIPFTFSETYDFSAPTATTPYTIKVWTAAAGDTYTVNDTIDYSFESKWTATDLTLTDVTTPYGSSYAFTYPDWLRVYSDAAATSQVFFGQNFPTPILYDTVSYWMEAVQVNGAPINIQVGTGTITNSYAPFYYLYHYGWSAAIYKRSEFNNFGRIDTVWFNVASNSVVGVIETQKLYLVNTADSIFTSVTQPNPSTMTLVYEGDLNVPASGWVGIPLSTPFNYDGSGNLMMYWENKDGYWTDNCKPVWASSSATSSTIYKYQDAGFPEGVAGVIGSSRPNARFTGMKISCPSPLKQITVSVTDVPAQDAGVVKYNGPIGGTYLSATEHISVVVKNYGTDPITNFPVSYTIGNGTPVTETFTGTLNTLDTMTFVFATNQDLASLANSIEVKAYTSLTGDTFATNDTITGSIAIPVYCTSNATSPATDMDIGNVTFAGINNGIAWPLMSNPTAIKGYTDFTQTVAPAYLAKGGVYPFRSTQINKSNYIYQGLVNVYIDLNRNGIFDAAELMYSGISTSSTTVSTITYEQLTTSGLISIPVTAQSGPTRMRVVSDESDVAPACGTYTWGETEDYSVVIYGASDPDAALTHFVNPTIPSAVEGNLVPIKVNLTNVGTTPITAASIKLLHNGTLVATQAWTGSLASLASVVDSITTVSLLAGDNNFTAFVDLTGDNMHSNDTIRFLLNALPRYDVKPVSVLNPIALSCPNVNETIRVRITNIGQEALPLATNNVVVKTQVLINNIAEYQTTVSTGTLAVNGTLDVDVTTGADFSAGGNYRIRAIVFLAGDGNLANDTLLTDTFTIVTPAMAIPAIENFETFTVNSITYPNGWTSSTTSTLANKYQWIANAGPTQSGLASGPAVDHTLGNTSGKYAYVYGGYGSSGDKSSLTSRCYNFAGATGQANGLSFWYHMYNPGASAKIYVEYGSGNNWVRVDSLYGQQQNTQAAPWLKKTYVLPISDQNARIRFTATKGSTAGDIAIDDINLSKMLPDAGVTSIITPGSYPADSVMASSHVNVKVLIHNFGQLALDTIPVAFKLGTEAEVVENFIGTLAPGADVEYTFTATYVAPTPRMHYICAYTKLVPDADETNDRSCKNVTAFPDTTDGFNDFDVAQFTLSQNVPNPAAEKAIIGFNMPQTGKVMFRVTDVLGRELYTEELHANNGSNSIELNTVNFAPGIYYYWIEYKDKRLSKKMNIIR